MCTLTPDILAYIVTTMHLPFGALNGILRASRSFASTPIDRASYIETVSVRNDDDEIITTNAYPNGYRISASCGRDCKDAYIETTYKDNQVETILYPGNHVMGHVAGAWWARGTTESKHRFHTNNGALFHYVTVDVISGKCKYDGTRAIDGADAAMQIILSHMRAGNRADACAAMAEWFGRDIDIAGAVDRLPIKLR